MFHKRISVLLTSVVLLSLSNNTYAQNSNRENAPYSRFGIGEFRNGANTLLRGMGTITSAYTNPYAVNTYNPASYPSLRLTTYEGGGIANQRNIISGDSRYGTGMATFSHFNIGIPVSKHAGLAIGLRPYSHVYYKLSDTAVRDGLGNSANQFLGNGTLHYAFIGAGGEYKGFSVGFNFGYMFGTLAKTTYMESLESTTTYSVLESEFSSYTRIGDIYWTLGAMHNAKLNNKLSLRTGVTFAMNQDLKATRDEYWIAILYRVSSGAEDTAYTSTGLVNSYTIPMTYSAGVQLASTDNWTIGLDYTGMKSSDFRSFGQVDSVGDNAYRLSLGGEYTPDVTGKKLLQRMTYRLGGYYGQDYISLRNTDINYYAVTLGASIPFKRTTDRIHTALEVGRRGTEANGLFRETFIKFSLGVSLNDKWFIKRKYD